ncbi:MAG: hypothetical protein A2Z72_04960 [Omnitrophica bacterium RBG_13_46_9]|nr:MAG: hypothetical protein A2Z72_04960 [Omnitrophica bacterium RBG_13_46_9]
MLGRTLKTLIAILFIPVAIALTRAFLQSLEGLDFFNVNLFLLIGGFFTYPIFHIVFIRPMYVYTWGHEIVHVVATWLCGGQVTSFHISQNGGNVTTTKTNLFIRLSPYFVPVHAIFLILLYFILSRFYNVSRFSNELIFLLGFTVSFHIFMTIEVMKLRQPDIVKTGYLFSVLLIYAANVSALLFIMSVIFKEISFMSFVKKTMVLSKDMYLYIFGRLLG